MFNLIGELLRKKGPNIIYWVHHKDHKDPYKEGLICVSREGEGHVRHRLENIDHDKIRKAYKREPENFIVTVIKDRLTKTQANEIYKHYRPKNDMAMNYGGFPQAMIDTTLYVGDI